MTKRLNIFFSIIMLSICILMVKIYLISNKDDIIEAASNQSFYNINIAKARGKIFDCKKKSLTNIEYNTVACIIPSISVKEELKSAFDNETVEQILKDHSDSKPFIIPVDENASEKLKNSKYIDIFKVPIRYGHDQILKHVIGYIDSNGGVCGIEKVFNDYLENEDCKLSIRYKVNALNQFLPGGEKIIDDNLYLQNRGVVLTIDSQIQKIVEEASRKYLKKGAVVIAEAPTCKIRALASFPEFSYEDLSKDLKNQDCPFLNRAFAAYNVGSTFKLVTAIAALENGIEKDTRYNCKGYITVGDSKFNCYNKIAHKELDMCRATALSCNGYFVMLSELMESNVILDMAYKLGFNKTINFSENLSDKSFSPAQGRLPYLRSLDNPKTLANFSFGQGSLLATPIQIVGLINSIASGGIYNEPRLIEGLTDQKLDFIKKPKEDIKNVKVYSKETAENIKEFMRASAQIGTSQKGSSQEIPIAAKTATAQTGIKINGRNVLQAWFSGIFPLDRNPNNSYSMVILSEDGQGGANSCGPLFKEIVENMQKEGLI